MLGRVLNSHQQWLCRQLADHGYVVTRQTAVADTAAEIEAAVRESLSRADLVLTTGGLGPTSDDLTREAIARLLGQDLRQDPATLAQLETFFARRNRAVPERLLSQALVPQNARVLLNRNGTAPGIVLAVNPNPFRAGDTASWLIMLPGPTRELRPMFSESVLPLLQQELPLEHPFVCRTFRTLGLGESSVQEMLTEPLQQFVAEGLEIGYCARPGQVDVRLAATGGGAVQLVERAGAEVKVRLGAAIFGTDGFDLENEIIRLMTERGKTLALAESCTGGNVANRLTNVPGASAVLLAGFVTYSEMAKQRFLGVRAETLSMHGAVSEPTAREMAEGARKAAGSDYALAITGIAGPSGGTTEKPVGTVFIALASLAQTRAWRMVNPWDRLTFKEVTSSQALNHLRLLIEEEL